MQYDLRNAGLSYCLGCWLQNLCARVGGINDGGVADRQIKACLSGLLPMRNFDAKFRPWTPVASQRHSRNFSGYSPMMRHAQDTLSLCGGRMGLRAPNAQTSVSRIVLPNEGLSYCGAARAIPISRLLLVASCNRAIRRCLHGSGELTW